MEKTKIQILLKEKHHTLVSWLQTHPLEKWDLGPEGKWTTGQHVLHLIQSIKPLNRALSMPKFLLKYKFGVSNRDSRNYDKVVSRYQEKLAKVQHGVSPFSRNMGIPNKEEKTNLLRELDRQNKRLGKKLSKWNENDLDKYILPHPLMGRMPVREIVQWTAYHAEHHLNILKEKY